MKTKDGRKIKGEKTDMTKAYHAIVGTTPLPAPRQKNWFGRECHDSDNLIHWSDDHNRSGFYWVDGKIKTFEEYVDAIRAAYDLVHNGDPKVATAFQLLLDAQRHISSMEEGERAAGEDL